MRMAQIAQKVLRDTKNHEIDLHSGLLDYLNIGYMEALAHMEKDLPEGVYKFIQKNSEAFFYRCIEHATGQKN